MRVLGPDPAGVAEPVDAVGLKPAAFGRGGSTPSPGTHLFARFVSARSSAASSPVSDFAL